MNEEKFGSEYDIEHNNILDAIKGNKRKMAELEIRIEDLNKWKPLMMPNLIDKVDADNLEWKFITKYEEYVEEYKKRFDIQDQKINELEKLIPTAKMLEELKILLEHEQTSIETLRIKGNRVRDGIKELEKEQKRLSNLSATQHQTNINLTNNIIELEKKYNSLEDEQQKIWDNKGGIENQINELKEFDERQLACNEVLYNKIDGA